MQLMKCWEDGCDHLVEVTQDQVRTGRVYCPDHTIIRPRRLVAMVPAAELDAPGAVAALADVVRERSR